jgi:hypothetical protein
MMGDAHGPALTTSCTPDDIIMFLLVVEEVLSPKLTVGFSQPAYILITYRVVDYLPTMRASFR